MSGQISLINLGELSRPATVLIERVSDAVGGIFRPAQIRRVARAEADAAITQALAGAHISEIQQRAAIRLLNEEAIKQENMEQITARAAQQLGDDANPEDLDRDWLADFFEKSRNVSDDEMQSLWAKLLAGEATKPGTYSKRTVNFVSTLDKRDAYLFTSLCTFGWGDSKSVIMIFNIEDDLYKKKGIHFGTLKHLDDIGLIAFDGLQNYSRTDLPRKAVISYYGKRVGLLFSKEEGNVLSLGHVLPTKIGEELAPICGSNPLDAYFDYVIGKWTSENLFPYCPL